MSSNPQLFSGPEWVPPRDVERIWKGKDRHYASGTLEPYDRTRALKQLEMDGGSHSSSVLDRAVRNYGVHGRIIAGLLPKWPITRDQMRPWLEFDEVVAEPTLRELLTCSIRGDGTFLAANPAFCRFWEYSADELDDTAALILLRHDGIQEDPDTVESALVMRRLRAERDGTPTRVTAYGWTRTGRRREYVGEVTYFVALDRWDCVFPVVKNHHLRDLSQLLTEHAHQFGLAVAAGLPLAFLLGMDLDDPNGAVHTCLYMIHQTLHMLHAVM